MNVSKNQKDSALTLNKARKALKSSISALSIIVILMLFYMLYDIIMGKIKIDSLFFYIITFIDIFFILFITNNVFNRVITIGKSMVFIAFSVALSIFLKQASLYTSQLSLIIPVYGKLIAPIAVSISIMLIGFFSIRMGGKILKFVELNRKNKARLFISYAMFIITLIFFLGTIFDLIPFIHLSRMFDFKSIPFLVIFGSVLSSPLMATELTGTLVLASELTVPLEFDTKNVKTKTVSKTLKYDTTAQTRVIDKTNLPPIDNWDPNVWLGENLYGYNITKVLGKGGTSYIILGKLFNSSYAMKIPIFTRSTSSMTVSTYQDLMDESNTLREISSKSRYMVKLYAIHADKLIMKSIVSGNSEMYFSNPPVMIMEAMWGGDASKLIYNDNIYLSSKWPYVVAYIIEKMAYAVAVMHENGYVHLDLKPENFLFDRIPGNTISDLISNIKSGSLTPKLSDLGSAVKIGRPPTQYTRSYVSFEQIAAIINKSPTTPAMDIYSLGAATYSMLTRKPYNNPLFLKKSDEVVDVYLAYLRKDPTVNRHVLNTKLVELRKAFLVQPPVSGVPREFQAVLSRMTSKNPRLRPTAADVARKMHSIYKKYI
ncbi:protein kinase domain-containing protein [Picrophilus oshimae]|nr:protein kinase [Picrophilus oshimae]